MRRAWMGWFAGTLFGDQTEVLGFRVEDEEAAETQRWAKRLGVHHSELLREALHRQLLRLASENDAATWVETPLDAGERSLAEIADWGPRRGLVRLG